jgi:hypothetical protein
MLLANLLASQKHRLKTRCRIGSRNAVVLIIDTTWMGCEFGEVVKAVNRIARMEENVV